MSTVVKTFTWTANVDSFSSNYTGTAPVMQWQATGGDTGDTGCLLNDAGGAGENWRNSTGTMYWTRTLNFEDMGVPSGATVTGITSASIKSQVTYYSNIDSNTIGNVTLSDGTTTVVLGGSRSASGTEGSLTTHNGTNNTGLSWASNQNVTITLNSAYDFANNANAGLHFVWDTLTFTITYDLTHSGAGSSSGDSTAAGAGDSFSGTVSGAGTASGDSTAAGVGASNKRYWVGTDTSWNTAANWSLESGGSGGAGVPDSTNIAIFDTGSQSCTVDVAIDIKGLNITSGYSGGLDLSGPYSHAISGDVSLAGTGAFDPGNNSSTTTTIGGNFDYASQGSITASFAVMILTGTDKTITPKNTSIGLKISGSYTHTGDASITSQDIVIDNGASLTLAEFYYLNSNVTFSSGISGTITGLGSLRLNLGTTSFFSTAVVTCNIIDIRGSLEAVGGATFEPTGEIICQTTVQNTIAGFTSPLTIKPTGGFRVTSAGTKTIYFNGALIFDCDMTFEPDTNIIIISNLSNSPDITCTGDITVAPYSGTFTWSKGSGTLTLSGANDQSIDFDGETVEDIEINKTSGTVTLAAAVVTDSFTMV